MAVIETPAQTIAAASETTTRSRVEPTGLAAVLGTGDHKVLGRLFIALSLVFGVVIVGLGQAFAVEGITPATLDVFTADNVFQMFTLYRLGSVFLVALPLVIGVAYLVVPLQVGSRSIAFPRAAAAAFWAWLLGSLMFITSYAVDGGPSGGSATGVNLWIASFGFIVVAIMLAAVCLATTVLALRHTGLRMSRIPLYSWSILVASAMWLLTLPVLLGLLVLMYVDHRHAGGASFGASAGLFGHLDWFLRNPQIYVVAIPVLGFAGDVLATSAKARITPRVGAISAIGAFGVFSFGAFLVAAGPEDQKAWVVIALGLFAVLPVLAMVGLAADLFRRGSFSLNAGALYALAALLILLLSTAAGALGSIPGLETYGTIFDLGLSQGVILASIIASIGGIHWWAVKVGRQPATEGTGRLAALILLVGSAAVVIPDLLSGIVGDADTNELSPSWIGGIKGLNIVVTIGTALIIIGLIVALVSLLPLLKSADDVAADPWEGQSLEWLAPSPPPLANFVADLPVVTSAEPLTDLREEK
ncbi:MAG: cbb3-type cytochrome c oxidase subunit I [Aquihabitans sp.]